MLRLLVLLTLLVAPVAYRGCDKKRPPPQPTASPSPTVQPTVEPTPESTPTPAPIGKPSPYPVPAVDLTPYLHEQGGRTVTVDVTNVDDVGDAVNRADLFDGPGKLIIKGGGRIKTQIVLKHDSEWSGEYFCDAETLEGQILLRDGVKAEGKGAVFHEPTYFEGTAAITVFQTYASAKNNYASAENVTVKGMKIVGRQEKTDGGVRQSISFGNCKNCAAIENELSGIASIGIQFGGGAAQGNHAENVLAYRNKLQHFVGAAIALVNYKGARVSENDISNPGRKPCWPDPADPGKRICEPAGTSGIDIETNGTDDCAQNPIIDNNHIDYGFAISGNGGNGILGQNVYNTPCSGGLLVANNVIDGWGGRNGLEASNHWGLSGGLYFVGQWQGGLVVSNTVIRALQPGISCYACRGLTFQDTWLVSTGGGGAGAVYFEGTSGVTLDIRVFDDPVIKPGSTGWWVECDPTSGVNVFKTNAKLAGCKQ